MLLDDFMKQLAYGPVGDLALGGEGSGEIPPTYVAKVIAKLNLGLDSLHSRIALRTEMLEMHTLSHRVRYPLQPAFALMSGSAEADKFIIDSVVKPYLGDLLGIEGVYDSNSCRLPLNVKGETYGWHTANFDTLLTGYPVTGETFFVQYRQKHPIILADAAFASTVIGIPPALVRALLVRVGYEIYSSMTIDTAVLKANELLQQYEQEVALHELSNLGNTSIVDLRADRFCRDGWQ